MKSGFLSFAAAAEAIGAPTEYAEGDLLPVLVSTATLRHAHIGNARSLREAEMIGLGAGVTSGKISRATVDGRIFFILH